MPEHTAAHRQERIARSGRSLPPGMLLQPLRRAGARHTRFVSWMKLLLPIIATSVVALIVVWPQLQDKPEGFRLGLSKISFQGKGGQQVVNARFTGNDAAKRPFTVTADSALQRPGEVESFELEFPKADITMTDGTWIALAANTGTYHKSREILALEGGVNLFHDSGYEFRTRIAEIDLRGGTARGTHKISGQGPFGTISAAGFAVFDRGSRIIFTGKAKLLIFPGLEKSAK